jgi:cystathionine beta-lyase
MTPLYHPLQAAVTGSGRSLIRHQLKLSNGSYQIDFVQIEQQIVNDRVKLLLLCSPHNPSGRVWTRAELQQLLTICVAHHVLIASDEIWSDWVLQSSPHPHIPIASLTTDGGVSGRAHCITMMAPTKTWNLAGLHCSYVIIQEEELRKR